MNYSRRPTLNRAIANSGQDKYENVFAFGGEWIPAFLLTKANLLAGVNSKSQHSGTYDRSVLALKIKPVIATKAKENMLATQNNNAASACQKSDKQIDTKKEVAKVAGVSHDTIAKVVEYDIFAGVDKC